MSYEKELELLKIVRSKHPRVHCITNWAAQVLTANFLLAIGATPSLSFALEEVEDFVSSADALLLNLGTLDEARLKAIPLALKAAKKKGIPIVIDPVFVNRSPFRLNYALELMQVPFTLLRANMEEFNALKGAEIKAETIAITGKVDVVSHLNKRIEIALGHENMSRITAFGCAGTAVMAAALAVEQNSFKAASNALTWLGLVGEKAGKTAKGLGSFQVEFLDGLGNLA